MSLLKRSVTSTGWNVVANLTRLAVLAVRSILLARLLPVATFGVYAQAGALVSITIIVTGFGMSGAFLHRAPETEDEDTAAAVHLTLKLLFVAIWMVVMVTATLLLADGDLRTALLWLIVVNGLFNLAETPRIILHRRVVHRRLALMQSLDAILTTVVAVGLALQGSTLAALLATNVVTMLVTIFMLYVWRPVWRPHLTWIRSIVRYFLNFGKRNFAAMLLQRVLDQADDVWVGFALGQNPLGFYSRAYTFATYPRQVLAGPVTTVAGGTYAELKGRRLQLSRAFFRSNALLVRSAFLLGGLLALIAPEFIVLVIGPKWLPMLTTFRLMLVFTLLDPIKGTVANLFVAVGEPEQVVRARLVQLAVMVSGILLLGYRLGIDGVALAVDAMLLVGLGLLLSQARRHVDFSARRLFAVPTLALIVGLSVAWLAAQLPAIAGPAWRTGLAKTLVFLALYAIVLFALEYQQSLTILRTVWRSVREPAA